MFETILHDSTTHLKTLHQCKNHLQSWWLLNQRKRFQLLRQQHPCMNDLVISSVYSFSSTSALTAYLWVWLLSITQHGWRSAWLEKSKKRMPRSKMREGLKIKLKVRINLHHHHHHVNFLCSDLVFTKLCLGYTSSICHTSSTTRRWSYKSNKPDCQCHSGWSEQACLHEPLQRCG